MWTYQGFGKESMCEIVGCSFPSNSIAISCEINETYDTANDELCFSPSEASPSNIYLTPNENIDFDKFFIFKSFHYDSSTPERIVKQADEHDVFIIFDLAYSDTKVDFSFTDINLLLKMSFADGFIPEGYRVIAINPGYYSSFTSAGAKIHRLSTSLYASTSAFFNMCTKKVPTTKNVMEWLVDRQLETEIVCMCSRGDGLKAGASWEYAMSPFRADVRLAQKLLDVVFDNMVRVPAEYDDVAFPVWRESILFSTRGERSIRYSRSNINWHMLLALTNVIDDNWELSPAYSNGDELDKVTLCYADKLVLNNMERIIGFINDETKNSVARRIALRNLVLAINNAVLSPMCTSADTFVRLRDVFPGSSNADNALRKLLDDSGAKSVIEALMCGVPIDDLL